MGFPFVVTRFPAVIDPHVASPWKESSNMGELAVRSVLLSEIQSVLSIARRRYGYGLVHQGAKGSQDDSQGGIFHSFALLRARLLRCEQLTELNPTSVLRPFLDLVRHEHTSSTLTGAALEAVQHFLQSWDWHVSPANVADMLADIVDAVSQCRFQETSAESDQHVLVLVVHVLQTVLACPVAHKLSDHAMWQLIEALYALSRANRNDPHITLSLRATATSVLNQAIEFIFQSPSVYSAHSSAAASGGGGGDTGFGLPCAVKIVGFLCQKLQPRGTSMTSASSSSASFSSSSSMATAASTATAALLPTRREVLLSFTLLQRMLVACEAQQLAQIPSLMFFIKDDLCGAILRYGRLGASTDLKIAVLCLGIVRLLWTKLRPMLKMQLEALINGIFCHTLHWTVAHLDLAHPIFPNNLETTTTPSSSASPHGGGGDSSSSSSNSGVFANVDAVREEFTGEIVPLNKLFSTSFEILDCLVDLLAEPTLLPDLYVNYDCGDNRSDLTQMLFGLLSLVVVKTHTACQETSDEVHFLWAQAVGELALRGLFNALYVVYTRSLQVAGLPAHTATTGGSAVVAVDGELATTAEALHRKRQRKKLFQHGVHEFNRKPLAGIKYLQQVGFLPTPLDAKSLAMFLRSLPPGLNKTAVGMYLGAMGKEVKAFEKSDIHEADTMEFHRDVLEHFVKSFNFESDSIVTALRMFLASFRLPGEAQQIDRILNTFSMRVFEQCRDRFLMASPDVAYLMSFSLIMLNTDLHNSNIRQEKKMKLEDFIKNNRNYGEEVSKKQDLPDEFMTELYETIAKEEIKTREDDSKHGEVTTDRWKDLLYQAESNPINSRLIVHQPLYKTPRPGHGSGPGSGSSSPRRHSAQPVLSSAQRPPNINTRPNINRTTPRSKSASALRGPDDDAAYDPTATLLFHNNGDTGLQYDRDIFGLIQKQLKQAFSSVFQQFVEVANGSNGSLTDGGASEGHTTSNGTTSVHDDVYLPDKGMLQLACNGFVLCAATAASHELTADFNELFTTVAQFTGLFPSESYPTAYNGRLNGIALFCSNQSAPLATAAMLKIVGTSGKSMQKKSWRHFFHAISALREFGALPERFVYGPLGSSDPLLTEDESVELLKLVKTNREEMEKREALKLKNADGSNSRSSSFFSGMAWLMSALDSSSTGSSSPSSPHADDFVMSPRTPVDSAADGRDLLVKPVTAAALVSPSQRDSSFATSSWIQQTLKPYRLEFLIDELSTLPVAALSEAVNGIHDELTNAFSGVAKSAQDASAESSKRRTSTFPGAGTPAAQVDEGGSSSSSSPSRVIGSAGRVLSPAGCVLFEHLLTRLLSSLPRDEIADRVDGLWDALHAHYSALPLLLRPILVKNAVINGVGYDCAALTLEKALEGLFTLVLKVRNEKALQLLLHVLTTLVDMSADEEELLRPFLTLIASGFKRVADSVDLRSMRFDRGEWLTVSNVVGWAVEQPHAAIHAFAFLEKLVASEVWLADVETTFSLMELYTKTLLFALHKGGDDQWPPKRPMELLSLLFDRLHESDPEIEEEERLRQLGGMVLVSRHALRPMASSSSSSSADHTQQANDKLIASLECLRGMIIAPQSRTSLTGGAWLEILNGGLLVIGSEILGRKLQTHSDTTRRRQGSEDESHVGPFMFYERNVPASMALTALAHPAAGVALASDENKKSPSGGRRRRSSMVKDPLALKPHVMVVEMVSLIACEHLDTLLLLPRFANVWDKLVDQLLAFVEFTKPVQQTSGGGSGGLPNDDVVLAALERRSIMSAHEEILEHVKSIIRRLTFLLHSHETKKKNTATTNTKEETEEIQNGDKSGALAGARFHALMHVLVEKCHAKGAAFYEQLFPSLQEDAVSGGELTPPLVEEEEEEQEEEQGVEMDAAEAKTEPVSTSGAAVKDAEQPPTPVHGRASGGDVDEQKNPPPSTTSAGEG